MVIEPDVSAYGFDDFQKALELVKVGETAARQMLPTFRAWAAERAAYEKHVTDRQLATEALTSPGIQQRITLA
jgi:hypothetical protein